MKGYSSTFYHYIQEHEAWTIIWSYYICDIISYINRYICYMWINIIINSILRWKLLCPFIDSYLIGNHGGIILFCIIFLLLHLSNIAQKINSIWCIFATLHFAEHQEALAWEIDRALCRIESLSWNRVR